MKTTNVTTAEQIFDSFVNCIATSKAPLENLEELLKAIEHLPPEEKSKLKGAEMFNGGLSEYIEQLEKVAARLQSIKLQLR